MEVLEVTDGKLKGQKATVRLEWASLEMDSSVMVRFRGGLAVKTPERSRSREAGVEDAVVPQEEGRGTLGGRCQIFPMWGK